MTHLLAVSRLLDWPSRVIGRWLYWLVAAIVLLKFSTVAMRYLFSSTSIKLQDSVTYAHATLFMLMVGYAYLKNDHVRVDMIYGRLSRRGRALIDLGCIFLGILPLCALLLYFGWPYVAASWKIREGALFFGGLPGTYLLKTVVLGFVLLLFLQAMAITLRCIAVLAGEEVEVFGAPWEEPQ
ncbi:TRAP transporter small permease subunit [Aquibaculum arenosum]|uniref:TRAP transporter small permease protein n=1 Tax=Aquibaculum arenosum TaxID=3032591 RepID=A0ABT5YIN0_9PROT|nr:TRAP transporter small permease subunit [Fodinicurvata sp. CAU 1616]MDF2094802.1 TRAP transporter small permease subunit [Fodinicurvata sp. CAU 1616]